MKINILVLALLFAADIFAGEIYNPPTTGTSGSPFVVESDLAPVRTTANSALQSVDPSTMRKSGTTAYLQDWIPDNILDLWYQLNLNVLASDQGFIDGPGYIFDDENGILASRSSGQNYKNPGYANNSDQGNFLDLYTSGASTEGLAITNQLNGSTNFTVAFWMKVNSDRNANDYYFYMGNTVGYPATKGDIRVWLHSPGLGGDGNIKCQVYGGTAINLFNVSDPTWHHVAVTYDNETDDLIGYRDGVEQGRVTEANVVIEDGQPGSDGFGRVAGQSCDFSIDEAGIWWRVLASNEVLQLATTDKSISGALATETRVIHHLEEGSGVIVYNAAQSTNSTILDGVTWNTTNPPVATSVSNNMLLASTNILLSFTASNSIPTVITDTSGLTTNLLQLGILDLQNNVTNWASGLTQISSVQATQYLYKANAITNMTGTTNVSVIVSLSSNSTAVIKGVAAPCGQ